MKWRFYNALHFGLVPKFFLCCILLICGDPDVFAQQQQISFSHLDIGDGLSNNQIRCIYKDSNGYLWIGTMSGLNMYNGYSFKVFKHDVHDSTTIDDNFIDDIYEDHEGRIWVKTRVGFNVYHPEKGDFTRDPAPLLKQMDIVDDDIDKIYKGKEGRFWFVGASNGLYQHVEDENLTLKHHHINGDTNSIVSSRITDLKGDGKGFIWLIHQNGMLEKLDINSKKVVYRNDYIKRNYPNNGQFFDLYIDSKNNIWVYPTNDAMGVFKFNVHRQTIQHFHKNATELQIGSDIVSGVVEDNMGNIWIATDHGGIYLYNPDKGTITNLTHNEDDERSLSQNSITYIYKDDLGIIWVGTFKQGVNYYHENIIKFGLINRHPSDPNSLSYDDVNCFEEDEQGNLWIGTNGGGLIRYNRKQDKFKQFVHEPDNPNSLSNDVIVSLMFDHEQKLWIGTYFGGLDVFDGEKFEHYQHDPDDPASIADNRIWDLCEDEERKIWVGTLGGGLDVYDPSRERFYHYKSGEQNSVHSDFILNITKVKNGNIWLGTAEGVDVYHTQSGRFHHYGLESGLSNTDINAIFQDSNDRMWVGTREGLNLFNATDSTFTSFRVEHGLPDNTILTIQEDNEGNLWLSTAHGLSNMILPDEELTGDSINYSFKNYDVSDGLQGIEFNANAGFKTQKGELIFGGPNGFNIFQPENIAQNKIAPKVVLTDFQVFNESVHVGEMINKRVLLKNTLGYTDEITLKHNEDVFSLSFAALNYFQPEKCKYKYILEGFNNHWFTTDSDIRKATFTNLDAGEYVFKVMASNSNGVWSKESKSIKITVLPPFWETPLAFTIYFVLLVIILLVARKIILERERMKFSIEQERQEAKQMHDLDMMKIRFFTNVSHEFRTPLTLIITPLERLLKTVDNHQLKQQHLMMYKNARRLLNLVNQLLDFRKMEVDKFEYKPVKANVVQFIREITDSFSDMSEKKNITLRFNTEIKELQMQFDPDKLEKIMFNLLSNAFKFTRENGSVSVDLNLSNASGNGNAENLVIKVNDTGIGIPEDQQAKIFERFVQSKLPGSMINQGSGIGLALTSEFVKLHNGSIQVYSEPNEGSSFIISLPVKTDDEMAIMPKGVDEKDKLHGHLDEEIKGMNQDVEVNRELPIGQNIGTVLLVEDNEDFRFYLKDNLRKHFKIIEAPNGKEGWKKIISVLPDMIVSDVMMPEMDGIALCKKVKSDQRTSHIPVVLLTARASDEQKLDGLETGADDYITKPFNFELLLYRMRNLLILRASIQNQFRNKIDVNPSEIQVESLDEKLIHKAVEVVESNMEEPEFSVVDLSREMGMSRVHLYKKLLALTGSSPTEFIRTIRLKRAAQLLEQSQLNISEIAYQVGYNNPKYFTKHFKSVYNVLPSQYADQKRGHL